MSDTDSAHAEEFLPDVCMVVQACLDTRTVWNKAGQPELTPDVVSDILWSSRDDRHCDLIAAIEDGRCITTTALQDTAMRTLQKQPHNWTRESAEYMVTRVIGQGMRVLETLPISELRAIALDYLRPRIETAAPETLAPLDRYNHRAEPGDPRVDLEDLLLLAQVAYLQQNGHSIEFGTADTWCSIAAALAGIADKVIAYRYGKDTGSWKAHDLTQESVTTKTKQLTAPQVGSAPKHVPGDQQGKARPNAVTIPGGTIKSRQVNRGPEPKTKGLAL